MKNRIVTIAVALGAGLAGACHRSPALQQDSSTGGADAGLPGSGAGRREAAPEAGAPEAGVPEAGVPECSGAPMIGHIAPALGGRCNPLRITGANLRCRGVVFTFGGAPQPALDESYGASSVGNVIRCDLAKGEDCVGAAVPVAAPSGPVTVRASSPRGTTTYHERFLVLDVRSPAKEPAACLTQGHEL